MCTNPTKEDKSNNIKTENMSNQKLTIVATTWNLFGSLPPSNSLVELRESSTFLPKPDIIYFGTQEC